MDSSCTRESCDGCPAEFLCHCLQVTEEAVVEAVTRFGLQTIHDVRRHTGAGDGCTACHRRIRQIVQDLAQSASSSPICSVR